MTARDDKNGEGLALPLEAINVSGKDGWDFGWCVVNANKRVHGYCLTEKQAHQIVDAVNGTIPSHEQRIDDVAAVAWAYRKLKAFGVHTGTIDSAMMMDRINAILTTESPGTQASSAGAEPAPSAASTTPQKPVAWRYRTQNSIFQWSMWTVVSEHPGPSEYTQEIVPLYEHPASALSARRQSIKGVRIDGGYVIVTPAGRGLEPARNLMAQIFELFPVGKK